MIFNAAKVVMCCVLFSACLFVSAAEQEAKSLGIFSWKKNAFQEGGKELFSFMKKHGFTELYQLFSGDIDDRTIIDFLDNAEKENIDIYMLAGDPSWANDSDGRSQLKAVDEAARINILNAKQGIKGIVYDIEPYTLDSWKSRANAIMESFISGMTKAYAAAVSKELEVVLCIPFYYDNMGHEGYTEKLIQYGCDRVAIMNYFKKKEAENIKNEVEYALRHEKGIINIYEFKAIGEHGLREVNTYQLDGFNKALSSFNVIKEAYPGSGIMMAAHDYEALKKVLK